LERRDEANEGMTRLGGGFWGADPQRTSNGSLLQRVARRLLPTRAPRGITRSRLGPARRGPMVRRMAHSCFSFYLDRLYNITREQHCEFLPVLAGVLSDARTQLF